MGYLVRVSPEAQQYLYGLAVARNSGKRRNKKGWGGNTAEQNHYVGLLGEYAASRVFDGYHYSREIYGIKGDGGKADLVGPAGGINVKTRTRRGYDFALSSDRLDGFKADAAVLVWPGDDATQGILCNSPAPAECDISLDVVGIASYAVFRHRACHVDYGYGKRLALPAEWFTPLLRPLWSHEVAAYLH